jgi:hypothetical protein
MKKILVIVIIGISLLSGKQEKTELKPYVDFLNTQQTTAKEYVLN